MAWLLGAAAILIVAAIFTAALNDVGAGPDSSPARRTVPTVPPGTVVDARSFWAAKSPHQQQVICRVWARHPTHAVRMLGGQRVYASGPRSVMAYLLDQECADAAT